ncbi:cyclin-dependent protein kinase inhibitor SMR6-like [Silene latifolia]|uniref:cyclin-dependent protein kinase inhibitor SMR6-like n=1 Tax=Silene latifolia TaxID=37657 RepID=UPI003D787BC6
MGFSSSEKSAMGGNNNNTTWVIAGIPMRGPLKPVYTGSGPALDHSENSSSSTETEYHPTTPTAECSRIPAKLSCPPPPRKRKTGGGGGGGGRCNNKNKSLCNNGKREFFVVPPDLEAIFMRRHHVGC